MSLKIVADRNTEELAHNLYKEAARMDIPKGITLTIGTDDSEEGTAYQQDPGFAPENFMYAADESFTSAMGIGPEAASRLGASDGIVEDVYTDEVASIMAIAASKGKKAVLEAGIGFRYEGSHSGKLRRIWGKRQGASDAFDPIASQLFTPGSINWIEEIFTNPKTSFKAFENVQVHTGTEPWAERMNLVIEDFGGLAVIGGSGSPDNSATEDVSYSQYLNTQAIVNITVSYRISQEERWRAESTSNPFAGRGITGKAEYAKWALDWAQNYTAYNGVAALNGDLLGIFSLNGGKQGWVSAGYKSLTTILAEVVAGSNTSGGQLAYAQLAGVINAQATQLQFQAKTVHVGLSPEAWGIWCQLNYSTVYDPTVASEIFNKIYSESGNVGLKVMFRVDPMLGSSLNGNITNTTTSDIMTICPSDIESAVGNKRQGLVRLGMPVPLVAYPVIPQMNGTEYKFLARQSGVFSPKTQATATWTGFGINSGT